MGITVDDICGIYIEPYEDMEIYDTNTNETVFAGSFDEAALSDFSGEEVQSIGIEGGKLVINI